MKPSCHGASLVESLVALSVFAVGSAATGTWFSRSMHSDVSATQTMAAVSAIADLRERMRANPRAVAQGDYDAPARHAPGCTMGCTEAELAVDDRARFARTLRDTIGPSVTHALRCEADARCVVRVALRERVIVSLSFRP